jgi:hypothetical protein
MPMMKIEFGKDVNMALKGSAILRSLQNMDLPVLDLLVRESLQNSIDAFANYGDSINVSFDVSDFDNTTFSDYFEGINTKLIERFGPSKCSYLAIRDSNTKGLDGPLHRSFVSKNTPKGNLIKLVYDIGQAQSAVGAGGSWGLGKTIYYRVGIGLVLYYSRTRRESGSYEHRLAACLVENEENSQGLLNDLNNGSNTGTAWWGDTQDLFESTRPIIDEFTIDEILRTLNIKKYTSTETGTTIIIPYIDRSKLIEGTISLVPTDKTDRILPWRNSIEEYLRLSCQRWYFPRISNKDFKFGKPLKIMIDNQPLVIENFEPIFKLLQKLYKSSSGSTKVDNVITTVQISLSNMLTNPVAGYLSFIKVTAEDLSMLPPDNCFDPYTYTGASSLDPDNNSPIICFTRKPGMIVSYQTTGDWVDGIEKTKPSEFILGVFTLNSESRILADQSLLEEYVRKSEKSDHTSWIDSVKDGKNLRIIEKIQRNVRRKIKDTYSKNDRPEVVLRTISMGKILADKLLPKKNYGKKPSDPNSNNKQEKNEPSDKSRNIVGGSEGANETGTGISNLKRLSTLTIHKLIILPEGNLLVDSLVLLDHNSEAKVMIEVLSDTKGSISAEKWEDPNYIGGVFPFEIQELQIFDKDKNEITRTISAIADYDRNEDIEFMKSTRCNTTFGFFVKSLKKETSEYHIKILISRKIRGIDISLVVD